MARPRKWEFEALEPSDPSGVRTRSCWIEQATIAFLTRGKLQARWFRIQCIPEVLAHPIAVFRGWNREGFEDACCYVGRPQDHPRDGIEIPPPPGKCFMVFVLASGKIEEWGWEQFDPESDEDCQRQFGEQWEKQWPPPTPTT